MQHHRIHLIAIPKDRYESIELALHCPGTFEFDRKNRKQINLSYLRKEMLSNGVLDFIQNK
jgi:hypothetical protein